MALFKASLYQMQERRGELCYQSHVMLSVVKSLFGGEVLLSYIKLSSL